MDTTAQLPGFVELIELGGAFEPVFNGFYRASIGWDGQDPVRPFACSAVRAPRRTGLLLARRCR